jgi:glutamyl-tRNA synthetase
MRITHVMRAEEWIPSTPKHVLLYKAFGWECPNFIHMPLLRNPDKSKISKRKNPTSIFWYREQGYLPETLLNFLALQGFSMPDGKEIFSFEEFVSSFSLERINTTGPIFDLKKLDWLNGEYIRKSSQDEIMMNLKNVTVDSRFSNDMICKILPLVQERMKKLSELNESALFFLELPPYDKKELVQKEKTDSETRVILDNVINIINSSFNDEDASIEEKLKNTCGQLGFKVGDFFMTMRIAITGKRNSPPIIPTIRVLGKNETLRRLKLALEKLK